jgi:hypothetical protein
MDIFSIDDLRDEFAQLEALYPVDVNVDDYKVDTVTAIGYFQPPIDNLLALGLAINPTITQDTQVPLFSKSPDKYVVDTSKIGHSLDDQIVSVTYERVVKGINLRPKSNSWPHAVTLHLIYNGKNINVKISSNNAHICGCKAPTDPQDIFEAVLDIINMAIHNYQLIYDYRDEVEAFVERWADSVFHYKQSWFKGLGLQPEIERVIENFGRYLGNPVKTAKLLTKVLKSPSTSVASDYVTPSSDIRIVMMKANFRLDYMISFSEFHRFLRTLPGIRYTSIYRPDIAQSIMMFFPHISETDQQLEILTLTGTMTINQTSYNSEMMTKTRLLCLAIVDDFISRHTSSYEIIEE